MQGHMISLPYTPEVLHCRYVGDITSDVSISWDSLWRSLVKGQPCLQQLRPWWSVYLLLRGVLQSLSVQGEVTWRISGTPVFSSHGNSGEGFLEMGRVTTILSLL